MSSEIQLRLLNALSQSLLGSVVNPTGSAVRTMGDAEQPLPAIRRSTPEYFQSRSGRLVLAGVRTGLFVAPGACSQSRSGGARRAPGDCILNRPAKRREAWPGHRLKRHAA